MGKGNTFVLIKWKEKATTKALMSIDLSPQGLGHTHKLFTHTKLFGQHTHSNFPQYQNSIQQHKDSLLGLSSLPP